MKNNISYFNTLENDFVPNMITLKNAVEKAKEMKPDVIFAFGGKDVMDFAKVMRLLYEYP